MTPRPYHHGNLRAALVQRALEVLRTHGPEELSLRALARDLGVSPGAPSRHFANRQHLLDTIAIVGFEQADAQIERAVTQADDGFATQLDAIARAYVDFASTNPALLELMYSAKHDPQASHDVSQASERFFARLLTVILDGQRDGVVRHEPAERVALPIFAALHGYAMLAIAGMIPEDEPEQALRDVITSVQIWAVSDPGEIAA